MNMAFPVLVGDIGGTYARFSLVSDVNSRPVAFDPVRIAEFGTVEAAIKASVLDRTSTWPASMMLAIATPLIGREFRLTNGAWVVRPPDILRSFDLKSLVLVNDFTAQGLAALALGGRDLAPIGAARPVEGQPKVVIGPGTGLGIAIVVRVGGKWALIPGEGGHMDLGPRTAREFTIWPHLKKDGGRLSAEQALSGRGLANLYSAICRLDGMESELTEAADISRVGMTGENGQASEATELFLTLLARVAGDMALITLARGGIYISGGIAAKLLPAIEEERFRSEFENKSPHEAILRDVAIFVMTHPLAALEGLCACAANPGMFSLENSAKIFTPD